MDEFGTITISAEEYKLLIATKVQHEMLLIGLFGSASLNWDKTSLQYDDSVINTLLIVMEVDNYESRLSDLKVNEEAVDGNV